MLLESFHSTNFKYSNLNSEALSLDNYLGWLRDSESGEFIEGARHDFSKSELKEYINEKNLSDYALLLGVFVKFNDYHIGNIKFEPIDINDGTAWLPILIGEHNFRGKGYSFEIMGESMSRVSDSLGINKFYLGVNPKNERALKAYRNLGFVERGIHKKGGIIMEKEIITKFNER
jgi:ribosomal-protein-alanine N-acetyltransferase